jgi:hypothetical protein
MILSVKVILSLALPTHQHSISTEKPNYGCAVPVGDGHT